MKEIILNCSLKEKISNKSGKPYFVVEIQLTPNLTKQVFLEPSEIEAIRLSEASNRK